MTKTACLCEGNSVVECQLPKLNVAGSIPVPRSRIPAQTAVVRPAMDSGSALGVLLVFMLVGGCATVEHRREIPPPAKKLSAQNGIYHKVKAGETIWRIAKTYGVDVEAIVKSNNIPNVALIEKDQLVFIPGALAVKDVGPVAERVNVSDPGEFIWPVKGRILSYFGERYQSRANRGIAIQAPEGESVKASRSGKVVFADYLNGYAYTVILDHGDGFFSVYGQNSRLLVKLGEMVSQNQPLALLGKQGEVSFLHFEIRKNSVADNPLYYLP